MQLKSSHTFSGAWGEEQLALKRFFLEQILWSLNSFHVVSSAGVKAIEDYNLSLLRFFPGGYQSHFGNKISFVTLLSKWDYSFLHMPLTIHIFKYWKAPSVGQRLHLSISRDFLKLILCLISLNSLAQNRLTIFE